MPWTILGSAFLLAFSLWSSIMCVPPMEHILKEELLLTHAQTSLLFIAPILMLVVLAIPAGRIADRIGVRKAAGIGVVMIAVGTILRSTSTDASSLLIFTFIYGAGFGWVFPNLPKLVSTWVPREKAGMAMGILTTGMAAGGALSMAITMPLVFPITNTFQGVFFIWSIPPTVAAILWWILVREPTHDIIHGKSVSRKPTPLRLLLRNKSLWLVSILLFLNEFFILTWIGWSPALMMLKGATPGFAGLISSITIWVSIPAAFFMPRIAYKIGLRKPFLWAPSIILAFAAWGVMHIILPMSWLLMALVGFAEITRYVTIMALPIEMMPNKEVGVASGLMMSIGYTGGVIGPWIGGYILDITTNLNLSLLVLVGVSIASVGVAFKIPEIGPKATAKE